MVESVFFIPEFPESVINLAAALSHLLHSVSYYFYFLRGGCYREGRSKKVWHCIVACLLLQ